MIETGRHTLPDGREVEVVEITGGGLRARVATLGAAVLSLDAPDVDGRLGDVVLGHATLAGYVEDAAFLGVAVGRTAGRIRGAAIEVDGVVHRLDANDGANTLHGGPSGLHAQIWRIEAVTPESVTLAVRSPAGAGGYPGDLDVRLRYALTETARGGALRLDWEATSTAPTPVALTNHTYWNLAGHDAGTVLDHTVQVPADRYVALADDLTPSGETPLIAGSALDLRTATRLGEVATSDHPQIQFASGLDHDFWVSPRGGRQVDLRRVARVEAAGRSLDVWTTEPCVHLYDGAFLDVQDGKGGIRYGPNDGLAIETQPPPDALAHDAFPDVLLRPGETLRSRTVYGFERPRATPR